MIPAPLSSPRPRGRARRTARTIPALTVALGLTVAVTMATPADAATAKVGGSCKKAGTRSGKLVCTKKGTKLVWATAPAPTTTTTTASSSASSGTSTGTSTGAATDGIEGAWKIGTKSVVGYRVKETLLGQSTEAVGRTSAVTGTMTIAGTKATEVSLTADVSTLKSDDDRRDGQVKGRILETSRFPTATIKLTSPIDFGKVPADLEQVTAKATVDFTLHGVTKSVSFDVTARRNGATIEVIGNFPIVFADYGVPNPSNTVATVGDTGTLEFAIVFVR